MMESSHRGIRLLRTLASILLLLQATEASHYRGGIIMLRPTDPLSATPDMEIYFRVSWRRDSYEGGSCDDSIVESGDLIGYGDLSCSGCNDPFFKSALYRCTDFSITDNWSFGEKRENNTFSVLDNVVTIFYSSCCWVSPFGGSWYTSTTMSLAKRSDTGMINSTPRALTSLNLRLLAGCNHTITIPVTDPDNDIVRCRWATNDLTNECGSVCNGFPGAVLHEELCTITYDAVNGPGIFVGALMIEDFLPGSTVALSSVGLQFMVEVFTSAENCSSVPEFVPPTLPSGSCVAIPPNTIYEGQLYVYSGFPGVVIIEINTVGPAGLSISSISPDANRPDVFYVNVTWDPDALQMNEVHGFCYTAINSLGLSSTQNCIQLSVGDYLPYPIESTLSPYKHEVIPPGYATLHVEINKPINRPSKSAKMIIKDYVSNSVLYEVDFQTSNEVLIYNDSHVLITPNYVFPACSDFYIELERGVVIGYGCNLESEPITDKDFWPFSTDCLLTTVKEPTTTNEPNELSTKEEITTPCHENNEDDDDEDKNQPPCKHHPDCPCKACHGGQESPCKDSDPCDDDKSPDSIRIISNPEFNGANNHFIQNIVF